VSHSTCRGGEWSCIDEACSGVCEVFGNGQYHTFDSKWYKFDGHCQYTLVKVSVCHVINDPLGMSSIHTVIHTVRVIMMLADVSVTLYNMGAIISINSCLTNAQIILN